MIPRECFFSVESYRILRAACRDESHDRGADFAGRSQPEGNQGSFSGT
jgi:hypothetical protein